jgi:hypothetical protein
MLCVRERVHRDTRLSVVWCNALTEHKPMRDLLKTYRTESPGSVVIKHADRFTFGVPDMTVTENWMTSWWEVKHADPDFESQGIQELMALRLYTAGRNCHYIIYDENPKSVLIVRPPDIKDWKTKSIAETLGHDHKWVVNFIKDYHETFVASRV